MQGCLSYSQAVACTSLPGQKVTAEQCKTATAAFCPLVKRQQQKSSMSLLFLCSQRASWGGSGLCFQTSRFLFQSDNSLKYLWCHRSTGSCSWRRGTSFVLQCPLMNSSVQTVRQKLMPNLLIFSGLDLDCRWDPGCKKHLTPMLHVLQFASRHFPWCSRVSECLNATPCSTHK